MSQLKYFPEYFVAMRDASEGQLPLAFSVPAGTDAAAKKRIDSAKKWARGYYYHGPNKEPNTKTFKNEPIEGFRVTDDIKRTYWGGGNVVWRIADPRGFEVEISSANLFAIIMHAGIEPNGNIPGKCVWVREGSTNILLHQTAAEWKDVVDLTNLEQIRISNSTPAGSLVNIPQGKMFYLGRYWFKVDQTVGSYSTHSDVTEVVRRVSESIEERDPEQFYVFGNLRPTLKGDGADANTATKAMNAEQVADIRNDPSQYYVHICKTLPKSGVVIDACIADKADAMELLTDVLSRSIDFTYPGPAYSYITQILTNPTLKKRKYLPVITKVDPGFKLKLRLDTPKSNKDLDRVLKGDWDTLACRYYYNIQRNRMQLVTAELIPAGNPEAVQEDIRWDYTNYKLPTHKYAVCVNGDMYYITNFVLNITKLYESAEPKFQVHLCKMKKDHVIRMEFDSADEVVTWIDSLPLFRYDSIVV